LNNSAAREVVRYTGNIILQNASFPPDTGEPSAYALIDCGIFHKRTNVVQKSRHPEWNYSLVLPSVSPGDQMSITIKNRVPGSHDPTLDQIVLSLDPETPDDSTNEVVLPNASKIVLSTSFMPNEGEGPSFRVANLLLTLHGAIDLKIGDINGFSDPYVWIYIDRETEPRYKSQIIKKTLNPAWEELVTLDRVLLGTKLTFMVWDYDHLKQDDFLGKLVFKLTSFLDLDHEIFALQPRHLKDTDITGDLILSLKFAPNTASAQSSADLSTVLPTFSDDRGQKTD